MIVLPVILAVVVAGSIDYRVVVFDCAAAVVEVVEAADDL